MNILEGAVHDGGAANVDERRSEDVEAAGVEQGRVEEGHVVGGEPPAHEGVHRVGGDGAMGEDGGLGKPGAAARVAEHPRVTRLDRDGVRQRLTSGARPVGRRPLGRVHERNDATDAGGLRADGLHLGEEVRAVNQDNRLRVGEQGTQFGGAEAPVEGLEDGAELGAGEEEVEVLGAVHREHCDAVALTNAEDVMKEASGAIGGGIPLAPGDATLAHAEPTSHERWAWGEG